MLYQSVLILFSCLILSSNLTAKTLYAQNDLDILVAQQEYTEYFYHVKDILPTHRTKQWRAQLITTAQAYIRSLLQKENFGSQHREWVNTLSKWSILKSDNGFMQLYDRYKIEALKKNTKLTKSQIDNFWAESTQSAKTAFDLAKAITEKGLTVPASILQKISHGPVATFYCRDPKIQNLLQDYFASIFQKRRSDFTLEKNRMLNKECLKQWSTKLIQQLKSSSLQRQQVAFQILQSENLMNDQQKEQFLFAYFLKAPPPGESLNYAWNLISSLGKDYKKRWKLLQLIKNRRFLPGELFELEDAQRREAFLHHLEQNFPEYIDYYVRTCINYYNGIGQYPYGNPTAECQSFMGEAKNLKYIPTALLKRYEKAKSRF